ncbi:hypothetical protein ABK040_016596 [Willaertia magna]
MNKNYSLALFASLLIAFFFIVNATTTEEQEKNKIISENNNVLLERTTISQTNSSIVQLFSGYQVSSANLPAYAWNYFYLDVYDTSATIEISAKASGGQLYIQTSSLPTEYTFAYKYNLYSYSYTYTLYHYASSSYNYKRYYIGIRNPTYYAMTGGYSFSVNVKSSSSPSKPYVNNNNNCYQRNSFGLIFGLSFPMSLIVFVLFVTAISLMVVVKKQKKRLEELEKNMRLYQQQQVPMPLPVIPPQQLPTMVMPQNYVPYSNNAQEQHSVDDRSEMSTFTSAPIVITVPPQQMNNNMMGNQTPYGFPVYYPPMMYPQNIYQQPQNVQYMQNQERKL